MILKVLLFLQKQEQYLGEMQENRFVNFLPFYQENNEQSATETQKKIVKEDKRVSFQWLIFLFWR